MYKKTLIFGALMVLLTMHNQNIPPIFEAEEKKFLKCMHELQTDISSFLFNISIGADYDDSTSEKLFRVFKFLQNG